MNLFIIGYLFDVSTKVQVKILSLSIFVQMASIIGFQISDFLPLFHLIMMNYKKQHLVGL